MTYFETAGMTCRCERSHVPEVFPGNGEQITLRRARITWAVDIEPRRVVWAWKDGDHGRIPAGSLSIAAGREGTGKSSFGLWEAAHVTRGTLPGSLYGQPARVLYVAVEDSWQYTVVPRLVAAGADLEMVGRFDVVNHEDDEISLSLPHDNDLLEQTITDYGVKLVLIDPIMSVLGDSINASRSREVRRALDPLAKIADRTGCLIQGIAHFNKASGGDPSSRIQESSAFKDVPRSVFVFAKDDDGRVMTQSKNSLGRDDLPSLAYTIEETLISTKEGTTTTGRFVFTGESDRSVSDLLRDAGGDDQTERDEAVEWLVDYISSNGGTANAGEAIKAAAGVGIAKTTLTRARAKAKVRSEKSGMHGGWVWILAESMSHGVTEPPRRIHEEPEESIFPNVDSSVPSVDSSAPDCTECDHLRERYGDHMRCWQHQEAS
ncbi:AAA family ATPase [Kribbella turkmenica]|uniref:AAA family ATPase n=1 Tax=Kribbella turkmenica TaxID=2530375 RepID=UPI001404F35B|nr:AAA family ATPase [Kribbella turkmenica]